VDKGRFDVKTACTGSCLEDERVLKCTSGIYIFCNTIAFPTPSLSAFYCNYISNYEPVPALTAFSGQGDREFTPTVQALPTATLSSSSSSVVSTTAVSSSGLGGSSTAANPSASAAGSEDDGGDGGSNDGVNKGAIIAGVIGGIAGLALLVAGVFFVLRRRKGNAGKGEEAAKAEAGTDAQAAKETSSSHGSENGKSEVKVPVVEEKKVAAK